MLLRLASGLVLLAVALVALAPATLLDAALAARTGNRLHLVDARGVWWRGDGALAAGGDAAQLPFAWNVALAPLATGRFVVAVHGVDGAAIPAGTVSFGERTIEVRNLHVVVPAALVQALLQALVPAAKAVALRGDVELHAPSFVLRGTTASGTADAIWTHAGASVGPWVVDLGNVAANGAPAGDGVAGTVHGAGGDVTIDGTFDARAGAVRAALELAAAPGASQALRAMLPLLGPVDAAGRVAIAWQGDRR